MNLLPQFAQGWMGQKVIPPAPPNGQQPDGNAGGNSNPPPPNGQANGAGGGNQNAGSGQNQLALPDNPWQDPVNVNGTGNPNPPAPPSPNGNGGGSGNPPDPNQVIQQYIDNRVSLAPQFTAEQQELIRSGDMSPVVEAMQTGMRNMYRSVLQDIGKMKETAVDAAVEKALAEGKKFVNTKDALQVLYAKVPATLAPEIRPVADSVFARYMQHTKGDAIKAAELTEKYFQKTAEKFGGGNGNGSSRRMGGGQFDSGRPDAGDSGFDIDFVNMLTGQDQPAA